MRLGCFGCFALAVVVLGILVVAGGVLFLSTNILATPDIRPVPYSKADGYAAQQKLYEVYLRQSGRSSRKDPIVLTEREANAFLSQHLSEVSGMPVTPLNLRFEQGQFLAQGRMALRYLFQGPPFAYVASYVPPRRLDQPVWVTVRGRIDIENGGAQGAKRYGNVSVTELVLGRQPINGFLLYVMMGPSGAGLFRWPVPAVVEAVQFESGEALIRTR